ncbi:MAG: deoxyribose-phosphate aldolase [Proteobacteria bacterium]|nr:deoxyribose-phosphate aldolase [Pseudomonadota bacterium]
MTDSLNPGAPLDLARLRALRVNQPAVARRVAALNGSRSVKKQHQAAWLLRAIECLDLTTLAGDDTFGRVRRLCAKARQPLRADLAAALGVGDGALKVGAVCVYHEMVACAVDALAGSGIPVAVVSTGFPAGQTPMETKRREIELSVAAGAQEVDIVISRRHALLHDWRALYDEIKAYRAACGPAHLKAILATGELQTLENVARASWVAMMAGADFIKTSTGKEAVNATLDVSLVMVRAIRDYAAETGHAVGYKPAGGIGSARLATQYLALMKEELGLRWLQPGLFRIGASSLLTDIERQLEHHVIGAYSASYRHALP